MRFAGDAARLFAQALRTADVTEHEITSWRKDHPFRLRLAAKLRAETTIDVGGISHRLGEATGMLLDDRRRHVPPWPASKLPKCRHPETRLQAGPPQSVGTFS
jgi:hypothetical protein